MIFFSRSKFVNVIVILLLYFLIKNECGSYVNKKSLKSYKKKSFVQLVYTNNHTLYNATGNRKGICGWLRNLKHQHRLCSKKKGLDHIIIQSKQLTMDSCNNHFQYEQWGCIQMKKIFKNVYRETALMYSLATSAFMFLVAKACAVGTLENCNCASHGRSSNATNWQWGGCGDNTKYARKLTNKFFQLRKKGDKMENILRYNSELAVKVVMNNEEKLCKCHGISGSCSFKICFKRIRPYDIIVEELKSYYHNAAQAESDNSILELRKSGTHEKLLYLEPSPSFCPLTPGRRCRDEDNCATVCCGHNFIRGVEVLKEVCKCKWKNQTTYELACQQCEKEEPVFFCQ